MRHHELNKEEKVKARKSLMKKLDRFREEIDDRLDLTPEESMIVSKDYDRWDNRAVFMWVLLACIVILEAFHLIYHG